MAKPGKFFYNIFKNSIVLILFFALWEIAPRIGLLDHQFVPTLSETVSTIVKLAINGELFVHIGFSLGRALAGFVLASFIALTLGFLLGGWFKTFEELLTPFLQVMAQINPFSVFPLFILLFGIGEVAKIAIILWVCIWPIMFNTINGVKNIDPLTIKAARTMGTNKFVLFWKVVLPGAAPSIFTGIKLGAGNSFFMLIAAEMLGASAGLGWLVLNSERNYQIPNLYAAMIVIAVLGITITNLINLAEKKIIVWKEDNVAG
ncbi:MAG: ABC transporter permease [Brevinematales bacterium]|jgi:NitT/TauT family transport system permease protein